MPTAVITGASTGFGLALARALAERDWDLIIDARGRGQLNAAGQSLGNRVTTVAGDVADPAHRQELLRVATGGGGLDLLVNNAGTLGPSPLPAMTDYPPAELAAVYQVNVLAPLGLTQVLFPLLSAAAEGTVINLTSDAAVQPFPGWGGYGSAKAALDQLTAVLAAELGPVHPHLRVYGFDPGDLRTAMHQRAFPGEDISDRPEPATAVPALLHLLTRRPPSGRYRAGDLLPRDLPVAATEAVS